jgi:hypothetical protein
VCDALIAESAADVAQEVTAPRFGLEKLLIEIFGNLELAIDLAAAEAQA